MGYCATWQEHQRDVAEAIEERDAEWLAAVEELEDEANQDKRLSTSDIAAILHLLKVLKARMQK